MSGVDSVHKAPDEYFTDINIKIAPFGAHHKKMNDLLILVIGGSTDVLLSSMTIFIQANVVMQELMQELISVLQEKLHAVASVYQAILEVHLDQLASQTHAFELVVRSFPANPARQSSFYRRLACLMQDRSQMQHLASNPVMMHHLQREIQRVLVSGEHQFISVFL